MMGISKIFLFYWNCTCRIDSSLVCNSPDEEIERDNTCWMMSAEKKTFFNLKYSFRSTVPGAGELYSLRYLRYLWSSKIPIHLVCYSKIYVQRSPAWQCPAGWLVSFFSNFLQSKLNVRGVAASELSADILTYSYFPFMALFWWVHYRSI
jgi:hypothetical protein